MYKYIYPLIKWKIKPWLKYYIVKKGEGTPSEIITSASPITLTNSLKRKFKIFKIEGNSVQDGEPSPTNEVPIQNVTGNVEVKVENDNITSGDELYQAMSAFDATKCSETTVDNKEVIRFMSNAYRWQMGFNALNYKFKENTQYTIRGLFKRSSNGILYMQIKYKDGSVQNTYSNTDDWKELRIVSTAGKTIDIIDFSYSSPTYWYLDKSSWFIGEGDTTDYIEHEEQTAIFPLEEGQVLHKDDTIEDKIVQRRKTIILTGKEDLGRNAEYSGRFSFLVKGYENTIDTNNLTDIYCNIATASLGSEINTIRIASTGTIVITVQSNFSEYTVAAIKNKVRELYEAGTPIIIEIPLSEPIEIPFTQAQATAKAQIDSLHSYKGTTYISSTNEPSPIFEVQYYMEGE